MTRGNEREEGVPFGSLIGETKHLKVEVLNGGYPINFDRSEESVPASDIQITRGLLLSALIQAMLCLHREHREPIHFRSLMLSPLLQCYVVREWISVNPQAKSLLGSDLLEVFNDESWVAEHSGGARQDCPSITSLFAPHPRL